MDITHKKENGRGAFYLDDAGDLLGEMTYKLTHDGEVITIDHTEIDEELRGNGYGKKLVSEAVRYARENRLKIKPVCPFAEKVMSGRPDYQDVLKS